MYPSKFGRSLVLLRVKFGRERGSINGVKSQNSMLTGVFALFLVCTCGKWDSDKSNLCRTKHGRYRRYAAQMIHRNAPPTCAA